MDSKHLPTHVGNPLPKPGNTLQRHSTTQDEWPLRPQRIVQRRSSTENVRSMRYYHPQSIEDPPKGLHGSPDAPITRHSLSHQGPNPEKAEEATQPVLRQRLWSPFWLHPGVLFGFSISFLLMISAIIALYVVSEKNQGLSSQVNAYRYLW